MTNLIKTYTKNELVPFSLTIGWNTIKNKKECILPAGWVDANITNYKQYITKNIIESKKEEVINLSNCLALRMGTKTKREKIIIGLDIDNKADDEDEKIYNGTKKMLDMMKQHNINKFVEFKSWVQHTGNGGIHVLFEVTKEQYENIKNITNLEIDGIQYCIDVKANEKSFLIVEPSNYTDNNNKNKYYSWYQNKVIGEIPDWIYNLIKVKDNEKINKEVIETPKTDNKIDENNELEKLKPLFKLLKKERINKCDKWFILACLIKSLYGKNGINLLLELSRNSILYESDEGIINKYNEIKKRCYTINTFYYFLKKDNPEAYQQHLKERKIEKMLIDTIEINRPYLLDLDDNLNKDTILNNKIDEFFNNKNIKSFNLKSPYDTGKTQLMKKILTKFNPKKVLWISYRISLTNDIKGNFKKFGFKSYLDGYNYDANKLIIQLESLLNISDGFIDEEIEIPSYDLIIIDEVESILSQFNSPTFKGKSKETFNFLEEIIKNSHKLITLDGDISNRTYNFIKSFGDSINIINTAQKNQRIFYIVDDKEIFNNKLFQALEEKNKIVVVSQSRVKADEMYNIISCKYPLLNILIYTSFTHDSEKMKLDDVNNIWDKCDVLIYSPTIEAGVNFDKPHFNKIFGILSDMSTSQRSFIQMLNRVRKITDNEIILSNIDGHNRNLFKLNEVKEFYNYYDAEQQAKKLKSFEKQVIYKTVNNKRVRVETYDNYSINYLYNLVENGNKQKYYFMAKFKEIIESKGHTIKFNDVSCSKNDIKTETNSTVEEYQLITKDIKDKFQEIADEKLINNKEYNYLLTLKKQNKASEFDKNKLAKKYFCDVLGTTELSKEDIEFWYYNTHLINNYNNLLDIETYKRTNELKNNVSFEKLELVKDILNKLGFDKIDDTNKYITGDELTENFNKLTKENKLFTDKKASFIFFNIRPFKPDGEPSNKKIMGHLNSILDNYSIKLESKQIRIKGERERVYSIEILNKVDEIIKRRCITIKTTDNETTI